MRINSRREGNDRWDNYDACSFRQHFVACLMLLLLSLEKKSALIALVGSKKACTVLVYIYIYIYVISLQLQSRRSTKSHVDDDVNEDDDDDDDDDDGGGG